MLGVLAVLALVAARAVRRIRDLPDGPPMLARHRRVIPVAALVVCLVTVGLGGAIERPPGGANPSFGATTARLGSIRSNRYEYWRVAVSELGRHPLIGAGSGAFRVAWLRHRTIEDPALNAHSLYIETAAELGLVGLALLAAFVAGLVGAARRALRSQPALVAGSLAALSVYALHAGIDWDWQMPAATLPALALAGGVIGLADGPAEA
jgi:O-antigen ligase